MTLATPPIMQAESFGGSNPLDQLRPIIQPAHDISWWPLAPGWWLLLGLLIVLVLFTLWLKARSRTKQAEKKRWDNAYQNLEDFYQECLSQKDRSVAIQNYLQKSNEILKRAVHHHVTYASQATLTGNDWVSFLKTIPLARNICCAHFYGNQLYAKRCEENIPIEEIHQWTCAWLQAFQQQLHKKNPGPM